MTREEFDRHHAHNVFTSRDGLQAQVNGFDEKTQQIGIQYVCNGICSSIPVHKYLHEVTVLAAD